MPRQHTYSQIVITVRLPRGENSVNTLMSNVYLLIYKGFKIFSWDMNISEEDLHH